MSLLLATKSYFRRIKKLKNPFKNFTKKEWILWTLASLENPAYIPVVVNFTIFFFNDMYGFISWRRREILMDL